MVTIRWYMDGAVVIWRYGNDMVILYGMVL